MNTTLVVMAAGLGSRFGQGIKQLTKVGPCGEIIVDYSVYDAIEAGFDRVIFVIRKDIEEDFKEIIGNRIEKSVKVDYAFQELTDLPEGFSLPEGRKKPWGTGHAVLACRELIHEPFAVINADDYYGKEAFRLVHDYLVNQTKTEGECCMAGFVLANTLSENGGVTRGLCEIDAQGQLCAVHETKNIRKTADGAQTTRKSGEELALDPTTLVSMNFWGFLPSFVDQLSQGFVSFLSDLDPDSELTGEYLLPTIVDGMLRKNQINVQVCPTGDKWFGMTFQEDVPGVCEAFRELVNCGKYPQDLWGNQK